MQKVEYYFNSKHSESEALDGSKAPKLVDELAERLLQCHVLPDVTFGTGKCFIHPKQAATLKSLCDTIKAWQKENPDGKLAVFGHADAVGKEDPNKALSERRAKSVHAFLMKDAKAREATYKEEKWGLGPILDLLRHQGVDRKEKPGAIRFAGYGLLSITHGDHEGIQIGSASRINGGNTAINPYDFARGRRVGVSGGILAGGWWDSQWTHMP